MRIAPVVPLVRTSTSLRRSSFLYIEARYKIPSRDVTGRESILVGSPIIGDGGYSSLGERARGTGVAPLTYNVLSLSLYGCLIRRNT